MVGLFSWGRWGDISDHISPHLATSLHISPAHLRWGDVSDRLLGHPDSVDSLLPLNDDVLISGSSDGLVRVVGVHPNKVLGLVRARV